MLRVVVTENGQVRGLPAADPRITAFKGIPFAAPPVGENRWRAPQPAANWDGVRDCYEFAPISMQEVPGTNPDNIYTREWHVDSDVPISEDCLYLNVWTPAKRADEKLPVMVWIFGGGYQGGYTSEMEFDGERLARRGVILVSVSYRVNVFGFLTHPELIAEDPDGCHGNYGLLDQMAGFQWVQRNIAAFGGDPGNVTIFGQSAGAGSVLSHVGSPMTKGLFHKVIMQSGGGLRTYGQGPSYLPLEKAKENGARLFETLGVKTLAEARQVDAWKLMEAIRAFAGMRTWSPTLDGRFLLQDPADLILENMHPDIPYMFGFCGGELDPGAAGPVETVAGLEAYAKGKYGDKADAFLKLCNVKTDAEAKALFAQDDAFKGRCMNNMLFAIKQKEFGRKKNYFYRFQPHYPGWDDPGAFHSSELWFCFETLAKCWRPFKGPHYDLARLMCNYWANFAKNSDPNGPDADGIPMPEWKDYVEGDDFIISLKETVGKYEGIMTDLMKFRVDYTFNEVIGKK